MACVIACKVRHSRFWLIHLNCHQSCIFLVWYWPLFLSRTAKSGWLLLLFGGDIKSRRSLTCSLNFGLWFIPLVLNIELFLCRKLGGHIQYFHWWTWAFWLPGASLARDSLCLLCSLTGSLWGQCSTQQYPHPAIPRTLHLWSENIPLNMV